MLDDGADLEDVERLGNDLVEILAVFAMCQEALDIGGDSDETRPRVTIYVFAIAARDLKPVELGQMKVDQGDIVMMALEGAEGLLAVLSNVDDMAPLRQNKLQKILRNWAVFCDQHPFWNKGSMIRTAIFRFYHSSCFQLFSVEFDLNSEERLTMPWNTK